MDYLKKDVDYVVDYLKENWNLSFKDFTEKEKAIFYFGCAYQVLSQYDLTEAMKQVGKK